MHAMEENNQNHVNVGHNYHCDIHFQMSLS